MTHSLDWQIEGEIMTQWPQFAHIGTRAKTAIIQDIHGRFINNGPLWPSLRDFVTNYVETILSSERHGRDLVRQILERWGEVLSMLNVG